MTGGLQKASILSGHFQRGVWVISVSFYTRKGYIHCMHDVEYTRDTGIHAYNTSTIPAKKDSNKQFNSSKSYVSDRTNSNKIKQ